jgi:CBS domain containing-hemolysin-like protein
MLTSKIPKGNVMNKSILRFMIPKSLVVYTDVRSTVRQTLEKMTFHRYSAIPVLDGEGKFIGTVRTDDIFGYLLKEGSFDKTALEAVETISLIGKDSAKAVRHDASMLELIEGIKEHNFVPVVDDRGCFIGLILRREILNYLLERFKKI